MTQPLNIPDPWSSLRRHTSARIALGRAGASLPTAEILDFSIAHAAARDAVHAALDVDSLCAALAPLGIPVKVLLTMASDRQTYLKRPDLGRKLDAKSEAELRDWSGGVVAWAARPCPGLKDTGGPPVPQDVSVFQAIPNTEPDVVFMIADGLSAPAAQRQAPPLLEALLPMLLPGGLTVGPICIVRQARVAIEDEIGLALRAKLAVILIGERPGLGTAESLGAYLAFDPRPGRTDADRNCISNIRPGGLSSIAAAQTLHYLITESLRRRISGVGLKDERPALSSPPSASVALP